MSRAARDRPAIEGLIQALGIIAARDPKSRAASPFCCLPLATIPFVSVGSICAGEDCSIHSAASKSTIEL